MSEEGCGVMETAKKVNRRKWLIHMRTSNTRIAGSRVNQLRSRRPDLEVRVRYDEELQLCVVEQRAR